jgi:hypothetical protein
MNDRRDASPTPPPSDGGHAGDHTLAQVRSEEVRREAVLERGAMDAAAKNGALPSEYHPSSDTEELGVVPPGHTPPLASALGGLQLVLQGLVDATTRATFAAGMGSAGLGGVLLAFGIRKDAAILLIALGAFFSLARVGHLIDGRVERRLRRKHGGRLLRDDDVT